MVNDSSGDSPGISWESKTLLPPALNEAIEICGKIVHTPVIRIEVGTSETGELV